MIHTGHLRQAGGKFESSDLLEDAIGCYSPTSSEVGKIKATGELNPHPRSPATVTTNAATIGPKIIPINPNAAIPPIMAKNSNSG